MVPGGMQIWIQVNLQALKRYVLAKHGMCKYFRRIFEAGLLLLYDNEALACSYFTEQSQVLLL